MIRESKQQSEEKLAPPPEPTADEQADSLWEDIIYLLRTLRTEVTDLKKVLDNVKTGQSSLESYANYIQKTRGDISKVYDDLSSTYNKLIAIPEGKTRYGEYIDEIRHLLNVWEQMQINALLKIQSDTAVHLTAQDQIHQLNILDAQFKEIIYRIGCLTIPSRLDKWLGDAPAGFYIPFNDAFEDEIPDREDRSRLLNLLTCIPKVVPKGLIDAEKGLVYRLSPDSGGRWRNYCLVLLSILLAPSIVAIAAYIPIDGWPLEHKDASSLLIGWLALIAGVIVHIAISIAKRQKTEKGLPPIMAMSNITSMIDAKALQIVLKVFLTLVGFFGLVFTAGIENAKPLNAFLVGYSLDSFVELFGTSIEQKATTQFTAMKQRLGVTK